MLAEQTPARFIAFDLLARDDEVLLERPLSERRAALEALGAGESVTITPLADDPADAEPWLHRGEGVVAKDCRAPVPAGPAHRDGEGQAGADDRRRRRRLPAGQGGGHGRLADPRAVRRGGRLHVVGHSSGLRAAEKRALVERLAPYETGERGHGDPSRWKNEKDLEWISLRPELVVEVTFDHASGGRIRHGTKILRWREDKPPAECKLEQMDQ